MNTACDADSLPAAAQVTANTHIAMLDAALPGWLDGYYLVGSVALGAFDERFSDVDFVASVRRAPNDTELETLKQLHRSLGNRRLLAPLDGVYVPAGAFGGREAACPRFNGGRFLGLARFEPDSPDGWVLKRRGVCLRGCGPEALPFLPDWERILPAMRRNVDSYWKNWAADCRRPSSPRFWGAYTLEHVEWGVLGICRLFFSLRERDIASKSEAGEYALAAVPERWHGILREAMRRRDAGIPPQYRSVFRRRRDALSYVEYMISGISAEDRH